MSSRKRDKPTRIYQRDHDVHGSSQWATREHLKARHYGENGRIFLGYSPAEHTKARAFAISTSTTQHGLVIGPTRNGKGVCFTIPHCLNHAGSLIAMDIKDGEMALITARYRRDVLGHDVILFDPWDRVASKLDMPNSAFNPLDFLDPNDDEFVDNAFIIADAMTLNENAREPFWSDEARSLKAGLLMYVKTAPLPLLPVPSKGRSLGQMRAMLNLGPKAFKDMVAGEFGTEEDGTVKLITPGMAQSRNEHVRAAASRIMNKAERERSGILSTAQSNTHFLESPKVQQALNRSDFDPKTLENGNTSIYIIMPTDKHDTHNRLLRLLIAITLITASRFKTKPDPPISFILEEANALGHMQKVTSAYGLLAGQGVQMITVWQDLNQMAERYKNWQSMVANSGFLVCVGTRDIFTAEYLSKMCGMTTIEHLSEESAATRGGLFSDPEYFSRNDGLYKRALITPDEIMTMHPSAQLILLAHAHPVTAYKTAYFLDRHYRDIQGKPIYDTHPHYADQPLMPSVSFTKTGLDIGVILDEVLNGR